ncbi:MAG TPA: methanol/ethanol family PQQ-dependent dehydrogenase, partial [Pyrinomonadaceae bacterium]|nr:methanol/ethanol family PQQ-dependent dehydrogenase [Pyrinomonadaceae bacterium]
AFICSASRLVLFLASSALFLSCTSKPPQESRTPPAAQPQTQSSATGQARVPPFVPAEEDGQWTMPAKNYASTRYSGLEEINAGNVKNLKVAWTFSTGVNRGQEAAPLVVGQTMYVVTPYPNILYALDLTKPGQTKWKYEPKPAAAAQGVACCDYVNRGAAYADGKIFYNTLDAQTVAVDAETGKELWKTKLGDINKGESITMAPLVVKGKVLVGNSGGEFGVRGWITALNAADGKIAWRAYNTGPDADCLIGPNFKPFYPQDRGKDLGVASWPPDAWKIGGGTVWGWISYDPELDLIYHGTANPGPWNPDQRPGDNKWTSGIFARKPDTGEAVWFYQWAPHDLYDYDGINEQLLLDLPVNGQARKTLVRPERTGYVYVLDRATGEVLSANPFVHITSTKGVDLKTGELIHVDEKKPIMGRVVRDICPAAPGGKDWNPSAFSPRTGLLYIPHNNLCMDFEGLEANYIAGTPYVGSNVKMYAGPGGHRGEFTAWDPVAGKEIWKIKESFPVWSGAVVTAGDVVFYGTMEGWFKAINARTGEELWKFKTGSGIIGQPVVYRNPQDGKEYVAILSGVGGWAGAIVAGDLDSRDPSAALGFVNAMTDLPANTTKGGTLYVFALP